MPRFKLTIEYAGTRYSGWQIQKNAKTVQGEIDRAVRTRHGAQGLRAVRLGTHRRRRPRAGAGGASRRQHRPAAATRCVRRLNDELPADINILAAAQVPHRFHARHDAVARRYLYQIARRRTAFAKAVSSGG